MIPYPRQHRRPFADLERHLVPFASIIKNPLPPIEWAIEPLIPHTTRTVVFGEFGSMKSWLLLDLGLHLAAGCSWLGPFNIKVPRKVLYMDEEMSQLESRRRIKRLAAGAGFKAPDLPFRLSSQLGERFRDGSTEMLLKRLKDIGFDPDVIIVETLRRVLVGNENEANDVSGFWSNVSPIMAAGKTLIVSHHMRKPNTSGWEDPSRNRASGSTDILAGADSAFAIRKAGDCRIHIECVKFRAGKMPDPFSIVMCDGEGEDEPITLRYEEPEDAVVPLKELERAIPLIQEYLTTASGGEAWTKEITEYVVTQGVKERTVERALKECKKRGLAENVRKGRWRLKGHKKAA
jgi:hypothetical protein